MPDETENHTIRMLREMREENRRNFADVNTRLDGLTHIMTMLAGHIHQHEERLGKLEGEKAE